MRSLHARHVLVDGGHVLGTALFDVGAWEPEVVDTLVALVAQAALEAWDEAQGTLGALTVVVNPRTEEALLASARPGVMES